jgi:hypothetical protein
LILGEYCNMQERICPGAKEGWGGFVNKIIYFL